MAIRIHQLAKELGIDNKELMELLVGRGYAVKSVSSTIDNISAESIRAEYLAKNPAPAAKTPEVAAAEALKPHLPAGAIVRSAEDVARERAVRDEETKASSAPRTFAPVARPSAPPMVRMPVHSAPPSVKLPTAPVGAPPAVKLPTANVPPSVKLPTAPAGAPPMVKMPTSTTPPVVKMPSATIAPNIPPAVPTGAPVSAAVPTASAELKLMQIKPPIIVRDFATILGQKPFKLISSLMEMGVFASMNQILEPELAIKIAEKFGVLLEIRQRGDAPKALPQKKEAPKIDEATLLEGRPPVVCILGHVDHGKTTLIDYIRKTNVVAGEAGGITQHIGAYQITFKDKKITFLDTPGHSAFEKMRERGASMTDIAVLVVAADDGFKPQTEEALKHCRKTGVPVVVAINKIDTKGANIDRVKKQMQERNLLPEEWGGEVITVPVSALSGEHVEDLLDMLLLQAEILELKANPKAPAEGVIVESKIEVGRGPTATVIVQKGTLKAGDAIVCGGTFCKVRMILNERDEKLDKAPPSTPARIVGWSETPEVGVHFKSAKNEKEAREVAEEFAEAARKKELAHTNAAAPTNAAELLAAITAQQAKNLSVVVKADVSGSLEAIVDALKAIKSSKVTLTIIDASVGLIKPSDVELAATTHSTIIAFNTRQENGVAALLKHDQVGVISHNIIYELVTQVKEAMADLLDPIPQENTLGKAEIRQVFDLTKALVAGSMVTEGSLFRDKLARVWRGTERIGAGKISGLKRMKDDASEVKSGYECGVSLHGIPSFKEGDIIECYEVRMVKQAL